MRGASLKGGMLESDNYTSTDLIIVEEEMT